jgi:hypothetical protein
MKIILQNTQTLQPFTEIIITEIIFKINFFKARPYVNNDLKLFLIGHKLFVVLSWLIFVQMNNIIHF